MSTHYNAKICVGIVTYKQERLISRMLDSILMQKEFGLSEIIICDDCSPDGTWTVIQQYKERYPTIINPIRNERNMGIYGNVANMYSYVQESNSDIFVSCSGDDALCDGFFQKLQYTIQTNNVNVGDKVMFFGDYKVVHPNGIGKVIKQDCAMSKFSPLAAHLRGKFSTRSSAVTMPCFRQFDSFPIDQGVAISEEICDIQPFIHADKFIYMPVVGSIYYCGIGISTTMNNKKEFAQRKIAKELLLQTVELDDFTRHYLKFQINQFQYKIQPSFWIFCKSWYHYFLSRQNDSMRKVLFQIVDMLRSR